MSRHISTIVVARRVTYALVLIGRATLLATIAMLLSCKELRAQQNTTTAITLGDAARIAAERSATTAAAHARSAQAQARVAQQRSSLLPSLSSTTQIGARTYNTATLGLEVPGPSGSPMFDASGEVMGPIHNTDFRTQITQRVFDLPAVFRWKGAAASSEAARFSATAASEASAQRGATAYLRVLRAEARISARTADSALAAELLDIAQQQLRAGVAIALDVTRAESQLAEAQAHLISTRAERDRAMLELRRELAVADNATLTIADSLEAPVEYETLVSEDAAIRGALERRGDFKAALAANEGAKLNARAASTARLPQVSVFADRGTTGRSVDHLLATYSYGIQISAPVFDGFLLQSQAAEQHAVQREAEAQLQDARRQVEMEVRQARISLTAAHEEVTAAQARLRLAEQEVAQARERFRQGVSGSADVITASITLNGARDLVIDALTDVHAARVALASAQGTMTTLR